MKTIRAPNTKQATTLMVAVKCRPLTPREHSRGRSIVRVENKMVVVSTPEMPRDFLERVNTRRKERKYTFDHAFGPESTNRNVYAAAIAPLIAGVIQGLNATIFAYGATGSGKTYTMSGTPHDPGLMVLSLQTIFDLIAKEENGHEFEVTCSYLEVYNEVIYDLLEKSSGHLELREDPSQGIMVAGLKRIRVNSAEKIFELLHMGNSRRKTESTEANATSSRSHAVLEITVKRQQKSRFRSQFLRGKLALVDLAGSERAAETNNAGQKLRDGANINRSLLALANCINALGKQQKKGLAYVPYRNSKLTRILKDGLSGNSRTVMIATVSPADDQYHHTINTLKYADRAKEIKHIYKQKNIGTVDNHVADYQHMIDNLQVEVCQLKKELEAKESQLSLRPTEKSADSELSWLDDLSRDTNENVEERINLQKALFELEDINLHNRTELQKLDDIIAKQQCKEQDETIIQALRSRRQIILDNIRDNDEAGANYRKEIEINEQHRHKLQQMIDDAIHKGGNKTYLSILSQYRLLGMTNLELQFQIAFRDQIIHNQGEVQSNLWALLVSSGLNHEHIMDIAAKQGITIEDWIMPPRSPVIRKKSPVLMPGAFSHFLPSPQTSVYEILEKPCGTSSLVSAHEFSRTATLETQRNMDEKCLESTSYARNLNLFYQSLPQQPPFMQRHHCSFQISSHPCPPATLEKIHNWSSDSQIQHSCLSSPIHVPNASQGSSFYCNEAYEKLMPVTQLKTQPFTEYEQLAKGSYSSDESFVIQKDPERRKLFTNYMAVELNKDIHDNQKPNEGNVLFESPTGGGEAYFMHNEHSASISPVPYPHSIVYNNQHAYSQTHPFLSNTHYTPQDQITRKVSSMDSVYAGTKFYPCYGFKYSNSPQCQLWPN